jgi:GNAT superfamily N-acetyltransferase
VLIASEWGPPSGVVVLHWRRGLLAPLATARIDLLLVAPEGRRRGVGRLLLKAAAQAARTAGCGVLRLDIAPGAPDLRAFCEATGFSDDGSTFSRPLRKQG